MRSDKRHYLENSTRSEAAIRRTVLAKKTGQHFAGSEVSVPCLVCQNNDNTVMNVEQQKLLASEGPSASSSKGNLRSLSPSLGNSTDKARLVVGLSQGKEVNRIGFDPDQFASLMLMESLILPRKFL